MLGGHPHLNICLPLDGGLTSAGRYRNPLVSNVGSKWVRLSNTSGITCCLVCSELIIQHVVFFFKFLFETSSSFQFICTFLLFPADSCILKTAFIISFILFQIGAPSCQTRLYPIFRNRFTIASSAPACAALTAAFSEVSARLRPV